MMKRYRRYLGFGLLALLAATSVWGLQRTYRYGRGESFDPPTAAGSPSTEYSFARLIYSTQGYWGWRYGSWAVDYPKADRQFLMGVKRLSLVESRDEPVPISLSDPRVFQYPWLYAVEVGYMTLSDEESARLREYLLRGGFLIADDFHGPYEWARFENEMRKVFPDRQIVDVDINDTIFHCFYDVNEKMQVPGVHYIETGVTYEKGGYTPHYRGIYDDKGRLMVMISYNVDLGDAWEWADIPEYPEKFSSMAYRLGINYIVYSMTH